MLSRRDIRHEKLRTGPPYSRKGTIIRSRIVEHGVEYFIPDDFYHDFKEYEKAVRARNEDILLNSFYGEIKDVLEEIESMIVNGEDVRSKFEYLYGICQGKEVK